MSTTLSAGIWAAEKLHTHVLLGSPHPLLVHEDLSLSVELDELKNIWSDINKTYLEEYLIFIYHSLKETEEEPSGEIRDFLTTLQMLAKSKHYETLHKKSGLFFGSVLKKCLATYRKTCAVVHESYIDKIHDFLYFLR